MPTNWFGQEKRPPLKVEGSIFGLFANFDKCRPKEAGDDVDVDVGVDVRLKFGDSRFGEYLVAPCSRPEAASDLTSRQFVRRAVLGKRVKFRDPRLKRSPDPKPSETVFSTVFRTSINDNRK